MSPEEKFSEIAAIRIAEAENLIDHHFIKLHILVAEKGGYLEAARHLLTPRSPGAFSYGFKLLAQEDLLSLSIEQAAVEFGHAGLFSEEQLSNARARLAVARMVVRTKAALQEHITNANDAGKEK